MQEKTSTRYLYKIFLSSAPPPPTIPLLLPLSPLDAKDGFIHLSTASQIADTASLFFSEESEIVIGKIPIDRLEAEQVKWEVEGSPGCAHLYNGPKLGSGEIVDVKKFQRGVERWKERLMNDEWLEN